LRAPLAQPAAPAERSRRARHRLDALQGFGAYRPRRREHKALAEAHAAFEQIDDRSFALDPLGDEIDAEARSKSRGRPDACRSPPHRLEQDVSPHLDVTKPRRPGHAARPQVVDVVERESIAALGKG